MATQTGSIDLFASNSVHLFAETGFTNAEQTYATKSELSVTNEAVALRATKTEAAQMAQPNLAPLFSMDHNSVYDATDNPSGYWRTKLTGNGFTQLDDGWTHFEYDNTSGTDRKYSYIRPARVPSIVPGAPYTILVEIRNNAPTGTGIHDVYCQQVANNQFWGNVTGETIDADHVTTTTMVDLASCGASFVRRSYRLADTAHLVDESGFLFTYTIRTAAGCTNSLDLRMSIYEGIYDGPYKPYSGDVLYATQAELKVTADGISSEVSKKVGNNEIISKINQSSESIQIQADKVEITGDTVFSAINNDTGTTKISGGKIDATSITIGGSSLATQADVDSIEVGGRNLALDTHYDTPDTTTKTSDGARVIRRYILSDYGSGVITNGTEVTVSFEGKVSSGAGTRPVQIYIGYFNGETATTIVNGGSPTPTIGEEWTKVTRTIAFDSDIVPTWVQVTATTSTGSSGTTYSVRGFKTEMGNKATDWSPAPEDVDASITAVQDNLNATRTWYATSSSAAGTADKVATITPATTDFALAVGTVVAVKFDYANSVASPTLSVNGTEAKSIKRYGTTAPSTSAASSWNAGSVVTLTYDGTNWQINNWLNNNDYDRENYKVPLAASAAISAGRIAVVGSDGKLKLLAASAFDYTKPILYVATAYSSTNVTDVTTRTTNYTFYGTAFTLTNTHSVAGAAAGMAVYIVGTVSGTTFTPNSTVLTCTTPTSANGLVYLRLGIMTSATAAVLESQHPMYMFHDGSFQQCDPATVASAKTATTYLTHVDSDGLMVHDANAPTTGVKITDSVDIVRGGVSTANFGGSDGSTVRIGTDGTAQVYIDSDSVSMLTDDGVEMLSLRMTEHSISTTKHVRVPYLPAIIDSASTTDVSVVCSDVATAATVVTVHAYLWNSVGGHYQVFDKRFFTDEQQPWTIGGHTVTWTHATKTLRFQGTYDGTHAVEAFVYEYSYTETLQASSAIIGSRATSSSDGAYSLMVGRDCEASGDYSLASGQGTIAAKQSQAVFGEYNIEDTGAPGQEKLLVVGNGTSGSNRSDAFTVDKFGDVYIGDNLECDGWISCTGIELNATINDFVLGTPSIVEDTGTVSVANSTNTSIVSIQLPAGTWLITCSTYFASNATGRRVVYVSDDSAVASVSVDQDASVIVPAVNGGVTKTSSSAIVTHVATTTYYCRAWQNSGSALNVSAHLKAVRLI